MVIFLSLLLLPSSHSEASLCTSAITYEMAIVHCEVKDHMMHVCCFSAGFDHCNEWQLRSEAQIKEDALPGWRNAASIIIIECFGEEIVSENAGQKPEIPTQAFSGHTD